MEQTMCRSNRPLSYKKKVTERKLNLKAITMIDPVTGWLEITQYDDKREISIANLF